MMGSNPSAPAQVRINAGLYVLAARDMFRLLESKAQLARNNREPPKNFQVLFNYYYYYYLIIINYSFIGNGKLF